MPLKLIICPKCCNANETERCSCMNEPELFDVPVVKSPRLLWIEKHRINTWCANHAVSAGEEDDFGHRVHQWTASNGVHMRGGDTEDDALAALARVMGVLLWNEEPRP